MSANSVAGQQRQIAPLYGPGQQVPRTMDGNWMPVETPGVGGGRVPGQYIIQGQQGQQGQQIQMQQIQQNQPGTHFGYQTQQPPQLQQQQYVPQGQYIAPNQIFAPNQQIPQYQNQQGQYITNEQQGSSSFINNRSLAQNAQKTQG